jgi:hypothetical protein
VQRAVRGAHAGRREAEAFDAIGEVLRDLLARREMPRPVVLRRERERVQQRRYVARGAGIAIRPPGAADAGVLLDDDEIAPATLLQPDTHAEPAEAGADHEHIDGVVIHGKAACAWVCT